MEAWDYMRFVYMTEELLAIGTMPEGPSVFTEPDPQPFEPPSGVGRTGSTNNPTQRNPAEEVGKPQDETLLGGGWLVDPCWVLNEYPGMTMFVENGVEKVITGDMPLKRGPFSSIKAHYGWGSHGDGAWPWNYQGYKIELLGENDVPTCTTYGWTGIKCRPEGQAFPLDAVSCKGEQIGGDSSNVLVHLLSTMWTRFEECMRGQFPDCGGA